MSDAISDVLKGIINRYGSVVADDPRRLEALLWDLAGQHRQEIYLLVGAAREQIPAQIIGGSSLPTPAVVSKLTQQLEQSLGLAPGQAQWTVETWAFALGVGELGVPSPLPQRLSPAAEAAPSSLGPRAEQPDAARATGPPAVERDPTTTAPRSSLIEKIDRALALRQRQLTIAAWVMSGAVLVAALVLVVATLAGG